MGCCSFVSDAVDWVDDNVVDPVVDAADEAVDWVDETVIDPLVSAAEEAGEWVDETIIDPTVDAVEDFSEYIDEKLDEIEDAIEDAWDEFSEGIEETWDSIIEHADQAWEALEDATEEAWEWLEEKVDDAVDWIKNTAEKVYEFIVEDAIPYIVAAIEFIPTIVKVLGALLILPFCYLYKELFGEEEGKVIEGVSNHSPRLLDEFDVARDKINNKYVVFSDLHMYVPGDLDFFNNNNNSLIYNNILKTYANNNFHLIENGDVEDFWMRGGSSKGLILSISDYLPWPYHSEAFTGNAFRSANQVHALNIFSNDADVYSTIRSLFHDKGRYTRLIGNHDDAWCDTDAKGMMDIVYPGITVNDYCTLETTTGTTKAVLAHGHQSDIFNMPLCDFAGKAVTKFASELHELSFGEVNMFTKSEDEWRSELSNRGFSNKLTEIDLLEFESFSEYDLYKDLESIYGDSPNQPYLILGHTHSPKDHAQIPNWMFTDTWNWNEYSNSGTAGMWENVVVGLEVEYPDVKVVMWTKAGNSSATRRVLNAYSYGDRYLQ